MDRPEHGAAPAETRTPEGREPVRTVALCAAIFLAAAAAFAPALRGEFLNYEDDIYVTANPHVKDGFTVAGVRRVFTEPYAYLYIPLTWLSHMLDVELFGLHPAGHRAHSLLLHAANAMLLFLLLKGATRRTSLAFFVAAVFAVHPLQAESVAWVTDRKNVLSAFLWLLTMLAYGAYARERSVPRYLLVVALFALGLLAKPVAVTLPLVLLLWDRWPLNRSSNPGVLMAEKVPLFVLSAVFSAVAMHAAAELVNRAGLREMDVLPAGLRLQGAIVGYCAYAAKVFYPVQLSFLYPYPESGWAMARVAWCAAILILAAVLAVWLRKSRPYLAVGLGWFCIVLLPTSGVVHAGMQWVADRYVYVPMIGLLLAFAWATADVVDPWPRLRRVAALVAGLWVAGLACLAFNEAGVWRSSESVLGRALKRNPDNFIAHQFAAKAAYDEGLFDKAFSHYAEAARIKPHFHFYLAGAGAALAAAGRHDEAVAWYERALALRPGDVALLENLAVIHSLRGDKLKAIEYYNRAIDGGTTSARVYGNLGVLCAGLGLADDAERFYQRALQLDPLRADTHFNIGAVLEAKGETEEAAAHFRRALELDPALEPARRHLDAIGVASP
jgi:tetratricopeptide (TPR) repeat protein